MGNTYANAIDWYVNKLNQMHLIPVNLASMIRDISSKQLSDGSFTPRPLTAGNFTDAELDAIHRLAKGEQGYRNITGAEYDIVNQDIGKGGFQYGTDDKKIKDYLSPLRSVSTTIGQASVRRLGDDHILEDIYDFNKIPLNVYIDENGFMTGPGGVPRIKKPLGDGPDRCRRSGLQAPSTQWTPLIKGA